MRGSIKIGKHQYQMVSTGTKNHMQKMAEEYYNNGYRYRVIKLRGVASGEYGLYVLPRKVK